MTIPPPPHRTNRKGQPPAPTDVPGALFTPEPAPPPAAAPEPKAAPDRDTPMNFRVEGALKRRFDMRAVDLGVTGVDLVTILIDEFLNDPRTEAAARELAQKKAMKLKRNNARK